MVNDCNELPQTHTSCSPDSLTEVTAQNLFTGHEVPLVISQKEEFDGYLDAVIGELLVCICVTMKL